jgi:hypothetical protein
MTDAQIEAGIADDPDEAGMVMDWDNATIELPQPAPFPIFRPIAQP